MRMALRISGTFIPLDATHKNIPRFGKFFIARQALIDSKVIRRGLQSLQCCLDQPGNLPPAEAQWWPPGLTGRLQEVCTRVDGIVEHDPQLPA